MASVRGRLHGLLLDLAWTVLPPIRTEMLDIRWDQSGSAALAKDNRKRKMANLLDRKKGQQNQRERKKASGSRPLLAGSGRRILIRASSARILILEPDSNPHLRIWVGAALTHGLIGLFYGLFTDLPDFPDLNSYREDMLHCVWVKRGELLPSNLG